MKKFLSLVLALVMTMSLVTVSAGAKDFADDSDIDYKAAVDVISELGVVDGYSDNSFRPDGLLTRGAAAKIICNLILGPTTASALSASTAPFKDVPTTNVFAGYITYCAQQGIISGYGDGTFRPTGTLTGNAFMKMLLGALGYDASIEGYTGANWTVNVIKQAIGIGLDDGNDNFVGSKSVTRGEAALYAFNMLQTTMVEYDQQNTIVVGDITINTTSSRKEVANTGDEGIENDNKMQFAERYFTDLSKRSGTADEFERPSTTWRLKSRDIGTYADEADVTYTASVDLGDIYSDLGLTDGIDGSDVSYFVDGDDKTSTWTNAMDIVRGSKTDVLGSGNGVLTEVFYDEDADTVTVTQVNTYVGKVNAVRNASSSRDAYITVSANVSDGFTQPSGFSGNNEFETEDFAKDDIVAYTYSQKEKEIQSVELAESVTGAMSAYTTNGSVTVGGNKYDANATSKPVITSYTPTVKRGTDVTAYLDQYGYLLYVDADTSKEYAVVVKMVERTGDFNDEIKADLLLTTGEVVRATIDKDTKDSPALTNADFDSTTHELKKNNKDGAKLSLYDIVAYTINGDDEYEISLVADARDSTTGNSFALENGKNALHITSSDMANLMGGSDKVDSTDGATTFLIYDDDDNAAMYEGFANAPTVDVTAATSVTVFTDKDGAAADIVFIYDGTGVTVSDGNEDVIYIKGSNAGLSYNTTLGDHYAYDAFLNGDEIVIYTDSNHKFTKDTVIYAPNYNSKGVLVGYDEGATIDVKAGTASDTDATTNNTLLFGKETGNEKNDVIELAKKAYTYTDDCKVYYVDVDGNLITSDITSISEDDNDLVAYTLDEGKVSTVYIKVVDDNNTVDGDSSYAMSGESLRATASKQNFAVDFTTETALDSTYTVTVTITRKDNSMGDATVATKTVNAGSGTSQKIDTTIAIPADGNYVAEIVVRNSSNNVVASGETASTFVPAP